MSRRIILLLLMLLSGNLDSTRAPKTGFVNCAQRLKRWLRLHGFWREERDLNPHPTVLETAMLPLTPSTR
jgi:hypothetical protein